MSFRHKRVKYEADLNRTRRIIELDDSVDILNLIDKCSDINALLLSACNKGSLKCVKVLLERGANVNHIQLATCNIKLLELLIERGALINDTTIKNCLSRLQPELYNNNEHKAFIVNLFDRIENVNSEPFLTIACRIADVEMVSRLLARGANRDELPSTGGYALEKAVKRGAVDIVRLLLDWNNQIPFPADKVIRAFITAASHGALDVVRALAEYGSNTDTVIPLDIINHAFITAASHGSLDMVKVLAEYGADAHTAALFAATDSDELSADVAEYLLDHGANFHATRFNRSVWQTLSSTMTLFPYRISLARLYLERGADADARRVGSGEPLLLDCCRSRSDGYLEYVSLLLEHGANVNLAHPTTGETPLMRAALAARINLVRLLLENGADVMQVNAAGQTVLDLMGTRPKYVKAVAMCTDQLHNKPILK